MSKLKYIFLSMFFCGCATTMNPEISSFTGSRDFSKYKNLAVLPFLDAPNSNNSGQIIQGLVIHNLSKIGFTPVDRTHLNEILREHYLTLTGVIKRKDILKLGEILGVNAIVVGEVGQYGTLDRHTETTFTPWTYRGKTQYLSIPGQQWKDSYVSISLRILDIETGEVVYSGSGQYDKGVSGPLQKIANSIVRDILLQWVSPLEEDREIEIKIPELPYVLTQPRVY